MFRTPVPFRPDRSIMIFNTPEPMPQLHTAHLTLRPYNLTDIPTLVRLAGAREVAATTLRIPHPYTEQDAQQFLATCREDSASSSITRFAICLRDNPDLCGGVGLRLDDAHRHAELGYWLGVPFWGKGYATEAAQAMLDYGFDTLNLNRIYASLFPENLASRRVLRKIGMRHEGLMRGHILKWGEFHDLECYGMLKSDRGDSRQL
jgi:[ribosomal protein S5]-alanine N-acetyltransferase